MTLRYDIVAVLAALLVLGVVKDGLGAEGRRGSAFLPFTAGVSTKAVTESRFIVDGNHEMKEADLLAAAKEELDAFVNRGHSVSAIDDAAFEMQLAYRHAGYPEAVVEYEIQGEAEGGRVLFHVREGQRRLIKDIVFTGNRALKGVRLLALAPHLKKALSQHKPFPYVAETIADLSEDIHKLYAGEGYLQPEVRVIAPEPAAGQEGGMVITIAIREGLRFTVDQVKVEGDVPPGLAKEVAEISRGLQGVVYQPRQKLVLKSRLRDCYENAGYAAVAVTVEAEADETNGLVRLSARVDSGRQLVVDAIKIVGNERTTPDFIRSRLSLTPGAQYRLDDKQSSFHDLYQTGLFSNVDISLLPGAGPDSRTAQVLVEERKAREIFLEPGWGSYELLRLKSGYKDRNIFGSGRILRAESAVSTMGRSLELGVSDPWFLGSDVTMDLPFYYRYRTEPVFTMEESGANLYLTKVIHENVTVNMGYKYSKNVVSDVGQDVDQLRLATNYNTASVSGQLTRDTRDDLFFPSRGYRGSVSLEVARPELGGTIAYNRLVTGVRCFYPLPGGSILGLRFNTGVIMPAAGQQSIPVGERFFNGGESSVRSFKASRLGPVDSDGEPLGGTAFSTYAVEWRQKLNEDWAWSLFFDLGNVSPNLSKVDGQSPLAADRDELIRATWDDYFSDLRSGVGTGLQYLLPVGPARLDLAFNPDRDETRDEAAYVVHFSIGMAF